jgi:hypothetical protein
MQIRTMQERREQHCKMARCSSNMTGIGQEIWSVEADESVNGPVIFWLLCRQHPRCLGKWFPPVYNTAGCSVAVRWAERRAEEASADNGRGHMALVEIGEKDQVTGLDGLDNEICLTLIVG